MIETVSIAGEATFDATPEVMSGLSQFNFVFGANGTGKTTLSRVIAKCDAYPGCSLSWKNGTKVETVVYNRDFVSTNFHQCDELPGIFTLGEKNTETIRQIAEAQRERDELIRNLEEMTKTLQGADGIGGKKAELAILEDGFKDACWAQKLKHDPILKGAFEGYRNSQEKFKDKVLSESNSNAAVLCDLADLQNRAATVFAESITLATAIAMVDFTVFVAYEKNPILAKRVVGKSDIDIAALIVKLSNSDWVKAGRSFYNIVDGICPFCQQKTPKSLETSLNAYFDEAFEKDSTAINDLDTNYKTENVRIQQRLNQILSSAHPFLDVVRLQEEKDLLDAKVLLNLQHFARKKKEPSLSVALESLSNVVHAIKTIIDDANSKVAAHNTTVTNLDSEKKKLTEQVWRYILDVELKANLETFTTKKANVNAAIQSLRQKIKDQERLIAGKKDKIADLEKETTSIQPTIDEINRLLKSFGFRGFQLTKADNQRCYKLIRPDGSDARETLSEGERTFVTFLYFYYLVKGSTSESGTATNRIVVFDDPVSSLDSDILFIVGSLIKGLFDEVRSGNGQLKQVFVLTHNVYFHKEVSFNPNRHQVAMSEETFWTIRKADLKSTIQKHRTNPIKTSYELLWAEVRSQSRTNLTIQNTLRRILENYFRILGGVNPDDICNRFEGKDRLICKSLFSWVNDGSHSAHDDLYVSIEDSVVDGYLRVFREIFTRTGHLPHYKMMMGDTFVETAPVSAEVSNSRGLPGDTERP
jgi:wobble nucleotide-excising tRNase